VQRDVPQASASKDFIEWDVEKGAVVEVAPQFWAKQEDTFNGHNRLDIDTETSAVDSMALLSRARQGTRGKE